MKFRLSERMNYMLIDIKQRSQITLPKALLNKLGLSTGDILEIDEKDGVLVLTPVMVIPKEQAWYFTKEWQDAEKEVDQEIKEGKVYTSNDMDSLFADMGISE